MSKTCDNDLHQYCYRPDVPKLEGMSKAIVEQGYEVTSALGIVSGMMNKRATQTYFFYRGMTI